MYVPTSIISNQYAAVTNALMLHNEAESEVFGTHAQEDALLLAMVTAAVEYAQELYPGTSVLIEMETYLMSLYGPYVRNVNDLLLRVDGEPVTIDKEQLIYIQ
jgi:hypothetical protein